MEGGNDKPSKKLIRSKSGLRIVVMDDDLRSPFVIGEPEWTPDKEVSNCRKCSAKFGFTTRKHHCRRCGHIYCAACCDEKLDLRRMCFIDPVRICDDCAPMTIEENKFFECQLKILTNGASFIYDRPSSSLFSSSDYQDKRSLDLCRNDDNNVVICKLSQDNRYLIFDSSVSSDDIIESKSGDNSTTILNPLRLDRIKGLRVYNDVPPAGVTSVEFDYIMSGAAISNDNSDCKEVTNTVRLSVPFNDHDYKQSTDWILAMQQAYKLIYEKDSEFEKCIDGNVNNKDCNR